MNVDSELEEWRGAWQSDAEVPADLRVRVARQSRWMHVMLAADVAVTVVIGGGTIALAVRAPHADMVLLAAVTWVFLACAWAFRTIWDRGLWSPSAMDTAAFVNLLMRRCRARLAATVFGVALYVCEVAFCLGRIYRRESPRPPLGGWLFGSMFINMVWLITLLFFGALLWYWRRKRAELAWLRGLNQG